MEQERQQQQEDTSSKELTVERAVVSAAKDVQSSTQDASPVFAGPTSAEFGFGVARIILQDDNAAIPGSTPCLDADLATSGNADEDGEPSEHLYLGTISSPLYGLQLHDVTRLIQLYHESINILHPVVEMEILQHLATSLFRNDEHETPISEGSPSSRSIDLVHLKMVIAISLLAEGGGFSPLARMIHDDLLPVITSHVLAKTFTLGGHILLLLTVSGPTSPKSPSPQISGTS